MSQFTRSNSPGHYCPGEQVIGLVAAPALGLKRFQHSIQ